MPDLPAGSVFTPHEVADILKVKIRTIHKWLRNGTLRGFMAGRHWRINRKDLEDFMATRPEDPPQA